MAAHLSYLEFKNFCSISVSTENPGFLNPSWCASDLCDLIGQFLDYRSYVVQGSVRENPALERSVMMCNGVSQWVQLMILSRHTAQQRAQVFTKFIHVAQVSNRFRNQFRLLGSEVPSSSAVLLTRNFEPCKTLTL